MDTKELFSIKMELRERSQTLVSLLNYRREVKEKEEGKKYIEEYSQRYNENNLSKLMELMREEQSRIEKAIKLMSLYNDIMGKYNIQTELDFKDTMEFVEEEIKGIKEGIIGVLKEKNVCPKCLGKKTVYNPDLRQGDPYARSSECQDTCPVCDGNGEFTDKNIDELITRIY